MSEYLIAIIIGLVEGVTEFLPISSTGHMILVGKLLNFTGARAATFMVFIQLGAILAVLLIYWPRFMDLFKSSTTGFSGRSGIMKLGAACLPALCFGATFHGFIKENLFGPTTVAIGLLLGGIIMIIVERLPLRTSILQIDSISIPQAFKVGLFQTIAIWPGFSRSASTIIGGMLVGLDRKTAAEFSFLVAVPIMFAATGFDLVSNLSQLTITDVPFFALGFSMAFVSALVAVKLFIAFVSKYSMVGFGIYRIILALVTLLWFREVGG